MRHFRFAVILHNAGWSATAGISNLRRPWPVGHQFLRSPISAFTRLATVRLAGWHFPHTMMHYAAMVVEVKNWANFAGARRLDLPRHTQYDHGSLRLLPSNDTWESQP
jgi:hypothetical protein